MPPDPKMKVFSVSLAAVAAAARRTAESMNRLVESTGGLGSPDWIVIRPAASLRPGLLEGLDGFWLDRRQLEDEDEINRVIEGDAGIVVSVRASGRFETRDDGAVAEIFEVSEAQP